MVLAVFHLCKFFMKIYNENDKNDMEKYFEEMASKYKVNIKAVTDNNAIVGFFMHSGKIRLSCTYTVVFEDTDIEYDMYFEEQNNIDSLKEEIEKTIVNLQCVDYLMKYCNNNDLYYEIPCSDCGYPIGVLIYKYDVDIFFSYYPKEKVSVYIEEREEYESDSVEIWGYDVASMKQKAKQIIQKYIKKYHISNKEFYQSLN